MHNDICQNCGAQLDASARNCDVCGEDVYRQGAGDYIPINEPTAQSFEDGGRYRRPDVNMSESYVTNKGGYGQTADEASARVHTADAPPSPDSPYAPISTGGFIGILFLMLLPGVNLILLLVWAFGGCRKIAKRSFARAQLVVGAVVIFMSVLMAYITILAIEAALGMTISEFVDLMNAFL